MGMNNRRHLQSLSVSAGVVVGFPGWAVYTPCHIRNRKVLMRFRFRKTVFCAHRGQLLPMDYSIEEINAVPGWAEATGQVQP